MTTFIGRESELALLGKRLERVRSTGRGMAVALRGRRQVGKSRLVQEFCDRSSAPYAFFAATRGASTTEATASFLSELSSSGLPADPALVSTTAAGGWPDAFRFLASVLPDRACIVVLDELPWLAEQDRVFDGALQTAWDRLLSAKPVLLLLLGSDLHMMERLTAYDQPFYGRADNMVLGPLNPGEVGAAVGLDGVDALDAHLVSGGLPGILRSWPTGVPALDFLAEECEDPAAAVFGVAESALLSEFPSPDTARRVLGAVGSGDRTSANIASTASGRTGALASGTLTPLLKQLVDEKRVLALDTPLSTRPGKPGLYRVADSNLRLYLAMLRDAQELSRRGRPEAAFEVVLRRWPSWRGRAVEPLVREALELAALDDALPWRETRVVGGWWNRRFDPELDLVGADCRPVAGAVHFTGSIKWLATPFDARDLAALQTASLHVPGVEPGQTGLAVVSASGVAADVDTGTAELVWGPSEVLASWG
jgi:hypothetical protein